MVRFVLRVIVMYLIDFKLKYCFFIVMLRRNMMHKVDCVRETHAHCHLQFVFIKRFERSSKTSSMRMHEEAAIMLQKMHLDGPGSGRVKYV